MNVLRIVFAGLLLWVFAADVVSGLKCYSCAGCGDPFDSSSVNIVNCTGSCLKGKASGVVVRQCSPENAGDKCVEQDGNYACTCTSDLCNGARERSLAVYVMFVPAVITLLWKCVFF